MKLETLRKMCVKKDHGLSGYYCTGELFINDKDGKTVYNKYMDFELATELCQELKLELTEV